MPSHAKKEISLSPVKLAVLVGSVAVSSTVAGVVSILLSSFATLPADHFRTLNLVEQVKALQETKVDSQLYVSSIKTLVDNQNEMKSDIKELLKRKTVYND